MLELWNSEDCARYFRCSRRQFMERIKPTPGFPKPRYLPTVNGSSRPLWTPDEVRGWATAHLACGKHPAPSPQPH